MARKSSSGSWEKFAGFWISQRWATSRYASINSWVRQDGKTGKRDLQSFCYIYLFTIRPRVSASVNSIRPCRPRHSCLLHRLRFLRTGTPLFRLSDPIRVRLSPEPSFVLMSYHLFSASCSCLVSPFFSSETTSPNAAATKGHNQWKMVWPAAALNLVCDSIQ